MLVSEICTRALKLAGVLGVGNAAASAEDMDDAVTTFNQMLFSWALDGMDLGHSEAGQNDTLYVDEAYLKAIAYNLAIELSAEHGTALDDKVALIAIDEMSKVRAALVDIDIARCDTAIVGTGRTFDHTTGQ